MNPKVRQILGLLILAGALALHLMGDPLLGLQKSQANAQTYWYSSRPISETLGPWHGKPFEFEGWVYHYIPKPYLDGMHYTDPANPNAFIELSMVHSTIKEYLHDPSLCSYGQGIHEKPLRTLALPNSPVSAMLTKLTMQNTGQVLYQLSWYQWGSRQSQPTFWGWLPYALSWRLFHNDTPKWHFINLIYVDTKAQTTEAMAQQKLSDFAGRLAESFSTPPQKKNP